MPVIRTATIYGAWWGGNFRGARKFPVDLGKYQSQLVYSPHDYGPEVYNQAWFYLDDDTKTFSRQTLLDDYWYESWAYLIEEHISPLLMGEWGGWVDDEHDTTGENRHWLQELRDYMIDKHIHHTFWCFNENSSDTGGLVYDNFEKWDEVKYEFIKPALWQNDDGKFISLDHKIPVGANGISLGEYYGDAPSQPATETQPTETETVPVSETETVPVTETETSASSEDGSGKELTYGDVDESGKIDILDVITLNRNLLGKEKISETQQKAADVDKDGKPTAADSLLIMKYIVGIVTSFA